MDSSPLPIPKTARDLVTRREELRESGVTLVLTNGCFDLLHPGHLAFLSDAARLGGELWVGLNGDDSVRALKGPKRPILNEIERAFTLSSLSFVSEIFVFPNPRLVEEIRILQPDIYAKAGDYALDKLDPSERAVLEAIGAEIRFLPFLEGFSTTKMIRRIQEAF